MIFEYIFPRVFFDGDDIGDIVTALSNYPKNTSDILAAHDRAWADHKGAADAAATEVDRRQQQMELEQLRTQIDALITERDAALTKLEPAIQEILPALLAAGLEQWAESAITNTDPELGVFPMVLRLKETAQKPPYIGQCQDIKDLFGPICYYSKTPPTHEQASAMQAVLDAGCPSTGPVAPEYLNFHPWIKSEEA